MVDFTQLQEAIKSYDAAREDLIKKSRDILKLSKQIIYAVHRGEMDIAKALVGEIEKERSELKEIAEHDPKMAYEGSYKISEQEYVEAILYYNFVSKGELVNCDVLPEHFILGLADLPGELVRKAVFLAGKGNVAAVIKIKEEVDSIYGELLKFDFRDNEIRRKVDAVKYDLRKLEDLVLDLKLKGKID